MRFAQGLVWLVVLPLASMRAQEAQAPRPDAQGAGVIRVTVTDIGTKRPLAGVIVRVRHTSLGARTDSAGNARIAGVPAGVQVVDARRPGFAPMLVTTRLGGADSVELALTTRPVVVELAPVVTYETNSGGALRAFGERRSSGRKGIFLTEDQIRQAPSADVAELLRAKLPAVRVANSGDVVRVFAKATPPAAECAVTVFLEGVRVANGDAAIVSKMQLGGIEYYERGQAPKQFETEGCGVLLLWLVPS